MILIIFYFNTLTWTYTLIYDVAFIQWMTSCDKNDMTKHYITHAICDNIMFSVKKGSFFYSLKVI